MRFLEDPFFYNTIRRIIAGDQKKTKDFVKFWLMKRNVTSILDIGCGTGDFFYPDLDASYYGIDTNSQYISFAKKTYKNYTHATFTQEDFFSASCARMSHYDAILLISAMHHFSDDDMKKIFSDISQRAPKVIIIADIIPNPPSVLGRLMVRLDRGKYVRSAGEKERIIRNFFHIVHTEYIHSRLAVQYGVICTPKV